MVSGTNERFLQPDVAITTAYQKMEPYLVWLDYVDPMMEESNAFLYRYDDSNKSEDPMKETAPLHLLGGQFPELDMTRGNVTSAAIKAKGFSIRLPRDLLKGSNSAAEMMRAYNTAGFWLAELINTDIITDMKSGANTSTSNFSPDVTWDDETATPVADLRDFARDMITPGYPYRMTDIFAEEQNWYELIDYLSDIDVNEYKQKNMFGVPTVRTDMVDVPLAGQVHMLMSGIDEGELIGIDGRNPVAEMHYYNDPQYSIPQITYNTVDSASGQERSITVPNYGINFDQYVEPDTKDTIVQFWTENKTVVTHSKGILYSSSGI